MSDLSPLEREEILRRPVAARAYVWSWAGALIDHEGRAEVIAALEAAALGPSSVRVCNDGSTRTVGNRCVPAAPRRLQHGENNERLAARALFAASVFVPGMPGAQNVDTFRVTEALEVGALPVLSATDWPERWRYTTAEAYFAGVFGAEHPLPVLFSFARMPELVRGALAADAERLEAYRALVADWWLTHKWALRATFARLIAEFLD
jgi:hypothetical protein